MQKRSRIRIRKWRSAFASIHEFKKQKFLTFERGEERPPAAHSQGLGSLCRDINIRGPFGPTLIPRAARVG